MAITTLDSRTAATGPGGASAQRREHQAVRAEHGAAGHHRGGAQLGAQHADAAPARDPDRVGERDQRGQLEVRDRAGVLDARAVDERVARDRDGHRERQDQLSGATSRPSPRTIITPAATTRMPTTWPADGWIPSNSAPITSTSTGAVPRATG